MDLLIADGTVPLAQADRAPATGVPGYATNGNEALNLPATADDAYHYNMMMAELVNLVTAAGLTSSGADWTQVTAAVRALASGIAKGSFSLGDSGYQVLPSGLIIQWGRTATVTGRRDPLYFPVTFPNEVCAININEDASLGWYGGSLTGALQAIRVFGASLSGPNGVYVDCIAIQPGGAMSPAAGTGYTWIAVGY